MWNCIKIPKGLALLSFLLPWITVSCSETRLAEGNGLQLAFGKLTVLSSRAAQNGRPNALLLLALAAIMLGLLICFMKNREAAKAVLGTSLGAFALIVAGTSRYNKAAVALAVQKNAGNATGDMGKMRETALSMIRVEWHSGYYLSCFSLAVASLLALLVLLDVDGKVTVHGNPPEP